MGVSDPYYTRGNPVDEAIRNAGGNALLADPNDPRHFLIVVVEGDGSIHHVNQNPSSTTNTTNTGTSKPTPVLVPPIVLPPPAIKYTSVQQIAIATKGTSILVPPKINQVTTDSKWQSNSPGTAWSGLLWKSMQAIAIKLEDLIGCKVNDITTYTGAGVVAYNTIPNGEVGNVFFSSVCQHEAVLYNNTEPLNSTRVGGAYYLYARGQVRQVGDVYWSPEFDYKSIDKGKTWVATNLYTPGSNGTPVPSSIRIIDANNTDILFGGTSSYGNFGGNNNVPDWGVPDGDMGRFYCYRFNGSTVVTETALPVIGFANGDQVLPSSFVCSPTAVACVQYYDNRKITKTDTIVDRYGCKYQKFDTEQYSPSFINAMYHDAYRWGDNTVGFVEWTANSFIWTKFDATAAAIITSHSLSPVLDPLGSGVTFSNFIETYNWWKRFWIKVKDAIACVVTFRISNSSYYRAILIILKDNTITYSAFGDPETGIIPNLASSDGVHPILVTLNNKDCIAIIARNVKDPTIGPASTVISDTTNFYVHAIPLKDLGLV